ncbi:MAG: DUF4381 domain-containing protein [Planctomycetota bacterium]
MSRIIVADKTDLRNLVDIVLAPPAPLWPPAPGWYVVAAVALVTVVTISIRWWQRWKANAYRRAALRCLNSDATGSWQELPAFVKRVALAAWPREQVAGLSGEEWLKFLDASVGSKNFTQGNGRWLLALAYEPTAASRMSPGDQEDVIRIIRHWIKSHSVTATEQPLSLITPRS